jgi:hypothetical protein
VNVVLQVGAVSQAGFSITPLPIPGTDPAFMREWSALDGELWDIAAMPSQGGNVTPWTIVSGGKACEAGRVT